MLVKLRYSLNMTIVSVSWVRNEEDIIESFVRHNMTKLSRMIVINNASTDATGSILEKLTKEGLPLQVIHDESTQHTQGEALTDAMRSLVEPDAWVLPLDADEFLCGILDYALLPLDTISLLPWKTYIPLATDPAEACPVRRIRQRNTQEIRQFYKILIPPALRKDVHIPMGSHFLLDAENNVLPSKVAPTLHLAHFPVRSAGQIYRKVHEGCMRHNTGATKIAGQNFHWERWVGELPEPEKIDEAMLTYIATHYALAPDVRIETDLIPDPIPCACTPLYTPYVRLSPAPLGVQ